MEHYRRSVQRESRFCKLYLELLAFFILFLIFYEQLMLSVC
jgi:hypothetical protein